MKNVWTPYRIRQGCCMSHFVRFNHEEGSWQHLPPSGWDYLNVTRKAAAELIGNGAKIMPYRQGSPQAPSSRKAS